MLTATYSIVTISNEQKNARSILFRLQQAVNNVWNTLANLDLPTVESTLEKLERFDSYCHCRKVELYVIPAVRGTSGEIDSLIGELEALSMRGVQILRSLHQQLRQGFAKGVIKLSDLREAMELYCRNRTEMLAKEENELLPLVRRTLSGDAWFSIAAQFLSDDGQVKSSKRDDDFPVNGAAQPDKRRHVQSALPT